MWLDLVALAILAVFAGIGAARGALRTGMGLLALVVGYVAAIFLARPLGALIAASFSISEWLAVPLGGTAGFAIGYAGTALTGALLRRFTESPGGERSPRDRFLGACFGALRGALVVLMVSWLALWLDAMRETGGGAPVPPVAESAAARVTGEVVERGIGAALGDQPGGRMAARLAARPAATIADMEEVLESESIEGLRSDAGFWAEVEQGDVDAALARTSFRLLASDPDVRSRLADLGMVREEAAADAQAFREDVAEVLHQVAPRIRGLKEDPEVQALVGDPEVVAMLESGDTLGLLGHPGFRELVDRIASQPAAEAPRVP
jgi:membrane protein required for colicin V production